MTTENTTPVAQEETPTTVGAFSAPLYDHETQEWVETPDHEIAAKIASGRYTYQTGLKIPVVDSRGETFEIDSDNAYNEFKFNGFKPLTKDFQNAAAERQLDKSNEAIYGGNPVDAFIAGGLRMGTLGLSDVVAEQFAPGAAGQLKEQNPGASLAGEVVGGIATSVAAGPLTGALGKAVGARVGAGIVSKVAATAVPAAVEGAVFGVQQTVSEAALGNPDSVADALIANVGAGALFGGGIGAAFGGAAGAKPMFDKLVERSITGAGDAVAFAARKTGAKGLQAALNFAGEAKLGEKVDDFFKQSPEVRQYIHKEGPENLAKLQEQMKPQIKEAVDQLKGLRKDLGNALTGARDDVRLATEQMAKKAGDDILEAARLSDDYVRQSQQTFREGVASLAGEAPVYTAKGIVKGSSAVIEGLQAAESAAARRAASKLDALISSQPLTSMADEATFFLKVQETLKPLRNGKMDDASRSLIDNYLGVADEALSKHPNPIVSELYKAHGANVAASETLKAVADRTIYRITKSPMGGEKVGYVGKDGASRVASEAKTLRTLLNPQHRQAVEATLNNFDQMAPELQQFQQIQGMKDGVAKITAQQAFQNAVEDRLKQLAPGSKVNVDEIETIFEMVGGVKGVEKTLQKVRELQGVLSPNDSLPTRAIAVMKALGKEISPELQKLAQYEKQIGLMQALQKTEVIGVSPIRLLAGASLGDFAGMIFGLNKTNASRHVDTIQAIEAMAAKGARVLNKAVKTTTDALVGPAMQKAVRGAAAAVDKGPTLKEQRKRYPELIKALNTPMPPLTSAQLLPQVTKAVEAKRQQTRDFIVSKMSFDPFVESRMSMADDHFLPSDIEIAKINRYVTAADNPLSVLKDLENGTASPEAIETFKTLHPQVYKTLQDSVLDAIIEKKTSLSYKQKVNLSTLFDLPTDPTLRPEFIARMQMSINKDEGGRPEGTGGNRKISIDLKPSETVATAAQNITHKV